VPGLQPGAVHRARVLREDLGGKGINASRALQALGIASRIVGFAGGAAGQALRAGLLASGFDVSLVEVEGETRRNLTLLDEASGQYTKINEPGPAASARDLAELQARIEELARPGDLWVFCGSLPPGAPSDLYATLVRRVQDLGARAFLDSSGPALRAGLAAGPFAIKPNGEEAAELLGSALEGEGDYYAAARRLQGMGAAVVALTRGAQGLVLATAADLLAAWPPPVTARSPVGAGDAALAGLVWAVADGCDAAETARRAVACGTAAAMQEGTGVGDRALVYNLLEQVRVRSYI
jgi:1-phosphofructokinase